MFNELCDVIILPSAADRYAHAQDSTGDSLTAEYLEEIPIDLVPDFVGADREYVMMTMEYGPDFHGHERVLRQERVFHNFDPAKGHKSQFLHPILRYYAPSVVSMAEGGETAAHHVLEDTYTNFSNPTLHVAPMAKFLSRIKDQPLVKADPALRLRWADVAPPQSAAPEFGQQITAGTTATRRQARSANPVMGKWQTTAKDGNASDGRPAPEAMKARELKDLLKTRGMDTRGTKAQLISRLQEAYKVEL